MEEDSRTVILITESSSRCDNIFTVVIVHLHNAISVN